MARKVFREDWIFRKDSHDTKRNWNNFWDVMVNPLNPGSIYVFPGSVFLCNIMEKWVNGFSWNFMKRQARHKKLLARLFHICVDCFMISHLGARDEIVSNTTVKLISGFSWNFQDMLALTQGTIWNILGIISLTPCTQGSFFYFLCPCLLATSWNTGWMDVHEIFRI